MPPKDTAGTPNRLHLATPPPVLHCTRHAVYRQRCSLAHLTLSDWDAWQQTWETEHPAFEPDWNTAFLRPLRAICRRREAETAVYVCTEHEH